MVIFVQKRSSKSFTKKTMRILCDAHIPLTFAKLSAGAVKRLAKNVNILTIEELVATERTTLHLHIKGTALKKEIFAFKDQLHKKVSSSKSRNILLFEEKARNRNIRMRSSQRAQLIGLVLFGEMVKDIAEVLSFILDIHNAQRFREKSLLLQLQEISIATIEKRA